MTKRPTYCFFNLFSKDDALKNMSVFPLSLHAQENINGFSGKTWDLWAITIATQQQKNFRTKSGQNPSDKFFKSHCEMNMRSTLFRVAQLLQHSI